MLLAAHGNPKLQRLQTGTKMSRRETVGTLELLWCFTTQQAPRGDIGKWSDNDIEAACDWKGKPGALISALCDAVWLDRCAVHRLLVHDWAEHAMDFIDSCLNGLAVFWSQAAEFLPCQTLVIDLERTFVIGDGLLQYFPCVRRFPDLDLTISQGDHAFGVERVERQCSAGRIERLIEIVRASRYLGLLLIDAHVHPTQPEAVAIAPDRSFD